MRSTFFSTALTLFSCLFLACSAPAEQPERQQATPSDDVAFTVNGKAISNEIVDLYLQPELQRAQMMGQPLTPELEAQIRQQLIDQLIDRELLYQQAQQAHVTLEEAVIDSQMAQIQMDGINLSEKQVRELIKTDFVIRKYIEDEIQANIEISEEDARKFYDENLSEFEQSEQVKASHILVRSGQDDTPEQKAAARHKIDSLLVVARANPDSFAEIAKASSEGPSAPRGGDLGFFGRGQMVPPFEQAAFALKPGEISDVVETQFGYHIIKMFEKQEGEIVPFDSVKTDIQNYLRDQRTNEQISALLDSLRVKATIEIANASPPDTSRQKDHDQ